MKTFLKYVGTASEAVAGSAEAAETEERIIKLNN